MAFTHFKASIAADNNQDIHLHDSTDIWIGINIANTGSSSTAIVDVKMIHTDNSAKYLIKGASVPVGGSIEIIEGKVVGISGEKLNVATTTSGVDVWASILDSA